jgi:hypothetical protein
MTAEIALIMKMNRNRFWLPITLTSRCATAVAALLLASTSAFAASYPFFDDCEGGLANWTASGGWGLTTARSSSPSHAATDSPGSYYTNSTDSALTLTSSISLAAATRPTLSFQHAYFLESGYDFGTVEISTNGGASWITPALAAFTGTKAVMSREQIDLSAYVGSGDFRVRFHLVSDSSIVMDGWYLDDVRLAEAPAPVTLTATQTNRNSVALAWTASTAPNFAAYRVYRSLATGVDWRTAQLVSEITTAATLNATDITASPKTKYHYRVAVVSTDGMLTLGNEIQVTTLPGMDYPFLDNGEGGSAVWVADAPWGLSDEDAASPTHGWSDSPGTNYANGIGSQSLTLAAPVFLAGRSTAPVLSFIHKYDFGPGDSGNVEVSVNGGTDWSSLGTFTGTATNSWRRGRFSLAAYTNGAVLVRFRITTDASAPADGWHLDDISMAESPTVVPAPILDNVGSHSLRIVWEANTDTFFSYYAIFRSASPGVGITSTLVATLTNQSATTFNDTNLALDTTYYYRVYAVSPYGAFSPDSVNERSVRTLNNPAPFSEGFEAGLLNWNRTGSWGLTTNGTYSGNYALTDSPVGDYGNSVDSYAMTAVNLSGTSWPVLRFWDRVRLNSGDWGRLEVSTDGSTWSAVYGVSEYQVRDQWAEQSIDLSPWKGQSNLRIRFHLWSDGSGTEDGWGIDDLRVAEHTPVAIGYPFYEGFEQGLSNWLHAGWVADTNQPYAGSGAAHDTVPARIAPNTTLWLTLAAPLSLSNAVNPQLTFWVRGRLVHYSGLRFQVSTDGGLNWPELSAVNLDQGFNADWTRKQVSLAAYTNQTVRVRFQLWSYYDTAPDEDIFLDNIGIGGSEPGAPTLNAPAHLATAEVVRPTLVVNNAVSFQGVPLTHRFEVYSDAALSNLVAQVPAIASGADTTSWQVDVNLNNNSEYWWRCRATDGTNVGPWMRTASFYVNELNHPPLPIEIIGPPDGTLITNLSDTLVWLPTTDPDEGDSVVFYHIQVDRNPGFSAPSINVTNIPVPSLPEGSYWAFAMPLNELPGATNLVLGTAYHWRIRAQDNRYGWSAWSPGAHGFKYGHVPPWPARISSLRPGSRGTLVLEWTEPQERMFVEFTPTLGIPAWQTVAGPLAGTNWTFTPLTGSPSGFYRLRSE